MIWPPNTLLTEVLLWLVSVVVVLLGARILWIYATFEGDAVRDGGLGISMLLTGSALVLLGICGCMVASALRRIRIYLGHVHDRVS